MHFRRVIFLIAILQTFTGILMAYQTGIFTPDPGTPSADTPNLYNADPLLTQQMYSMTQLSNGHPWRYGDNGHGFSGKSYGHSSHPPKSFQKLVGYLNKKIINQTFEGRIAMILNMQEPLFDNPSQIDCKQNGTAALMGGYCLYPNHSGRENVNDNNLTLGINLPMWMPFHKNIQGEMILSICNSRERWAGEKQAIDTTINYVRVKGSALVYELTRLSSIDIVPIKISCRLSGFLCVGAGSLITFNAITHKSSEQSVYFLQSDKPVPSLSSKNEIPASQWYKGSNMALFADIQMGRVRAGPALWIRYMHCFNGPPNRIFIYACWRL